MYYTCLIAVQRDEEERKREGMRRFIQFKFGGTGCVPAPRPKVAKVPGLRGQHLQKSDVLADAAPDVVLSGLKGLRGAGRAVGDARSAS